ncbi:hypothetical protein T265_07929 [Opisthorchis viverrini]|uniref:Uncharacterized protein n=1 Tax=Opisthorchis viverrini TaxID=6198 RepID=A0A074ZBB5_OPIVI|nr:hypothetical protein T265_07929 [Opisthorchis viverrini]KER24418.1 hypothetical protein T265_07929 [Opisthorchis viverrini]
MRFSNRHATLPPGMENSKLFVCGPDPTWLRPRTPTVSGLQSGKSIQTRYVQALQYAKEHKSAGSRYRRYDLRCPTFSRKNHPDCRRSRENQLHCIRHRIPTEQPHWSLWAPLSSGCSSEDLELQQSKKRS